MDDKDRKEEEEKKEAEIEKNKVEIAKTKAEIKKIWVIIVLAVIAVIIYIAKDGVIKFAEYNLAKREFESEQESKEIEQQEKEEKSYPQMEIDKGGTAIRGDKKYQVVHISNTNESAKIKSGTLVVEYRIRGENNDTSINCYLNGAIYDEEVEYLEELGGGMFLLIRDYPKLTEKVEAYLEGKGIKMAEGMVFQPQLFIYYDYTCRKESPKGYYKVNIEEHGFGAVEAVDEPEKYFNVYEIELEEVAAE